MEIKEFKDDMIEKFKILDNEYVSDTEQKDIENILASRSSEDKEMSYSKIVSINSNRYKDDCKIYSQSLHYKIDKALNALNLNITTKII